MSQVALQVLEVPEGRIEYADVGSGFPILYFHGTGAASDAALLLEQTLVRSPCRLIIPHRPGYYRSTLGRRGSARFAAKMASELLDHLAIQRVAVIGTSGGGMPAASFARYFPDRSMALVMQCAQSHRWNHPQWLPRGMGRALPLFRLAIMAPLLRWINRRYAKANRRLPTACLEQMSGDRFAELREDPTVIEQITALTEMTWDCAKQPAGIQNDWSILVGDNAVHPETIECPTLIIHDRQDPLVPFAHAEWSRSCIRHARLLEIHAGGHLIWFGRDAARMHDERMAFLAGADPGAVTTR